MQKNDGNEKWIASKESSGLYLTLKSFGDIKYNVPNIYFGFYSRTGVHISVICSYKSGAIIEANSELLEESVYKEAEVPGEKEHKLVMDMIDPNVVPSNFEHTLKMAKEYMIEDNSLYVEFA